MILFASPHQSTLYRWYDLIVQKNGISRKIELGCFKKIATKRPPKKSKESKKRVQSSIGWLAIINKHLKPFIDEYYPTVHKMFLPDLASPNYA